MLIVNIKPSPNILLMPWCNLMKKNLSWKFLSLEKLYDEWEPTIKIKVKDHEFYALCDLGASVSTIPKTLCDLLDFRNFDDCSLNLHLADSTIKKPMGRISDVLIVANRNYVPVDFIVLDIDCNPTCPIILGRPFLTNNWCNYWYERRKH